MYVVQPVGPSGAVPATPAQEGRRVHFTSPTPSPITLGSENQAIGHQSHHQSQTDSQADDPFVGSQRNIVADALTQVFIYFFYFIFPKFITVQENFDMNVSPTSSETSQRGQNDPLSPTPHRQQRRAMLRAEKRAATDLTPFYEVYPDQTKHCKFCL
jgi:hypothetical protein